MALLQQCDGLAVLRFDQPIPPLRGVEALWGDIGERFTGRRNRRRIQAQGLFREPLQPTQEAP